MTNRDPEVAYTRPETAIPFMIEQYMRQHLHTAVPGLVTAYHAPTRRADVQPAIWRLVASLDPALPPERMDRPPILNVPVLHPSAGGFVVHFPIRRGDAVWLMFSERGMDAFKLSYQLSAPNVEAFFSDREAVALPGFGSLSMTPASDDGLSIQTEDGSTSIVMTPGSVAITSASLTHNGVNIGSTHTHEGVTSGPSRTGGPG